MVPSIREKYNREFTPGAYQAFLREINLPHPGDIEFRVAETPVFIPASFKEQLIRASEDILDVILKPDFKKKTKQAIPRQLAVPHENAFPQFIVFDFAISTDDKGDYVPRLIELQGFPSMNAFQVLVAHSYRKHFQIPANFSNYLNGYDEEKYWSLLRDIILNNHPSEEVVLLEVKPHEQKTRIDFYLTQDKLNVRPVCVKDLIRRGQKLYYERDGKKIQIKRIYNRVIFDDLLSRKETLGKVVDLTRRLDVEWVAHPNWFYRVSKYTLPLLESDYVPPTYFLNQLEVVPSDLENYVLKPLFSFAGQGVILDLKKSDIEKIKDPQNWILQRKIEYAPVIQTPDGPAKCEIRLMFFWKDGEPRPVLVQNLCRLSKGKMVGVRYNADKEWVGAGICFFEQ